MRCSQLVCDLQGMQCPSSTPPFLSPARSALAPSRCLAMQMGIVGEMREAGTKMEGAVAAAGEKLGFAGKRRGE